MRSENAAQRPHLAALPKLGTLAWAAILSYGPLLGAAELGLSGAVEFGQSAAEGGQQNGLLTTNKVCRPRFCVNPILPGLMRFGENVITAHKNMSWTCAESSAAWGRTGICERIVAAYPFAVAQPADGQTTTEEELVMSQARQALTAYVAHLAGIGYDFWDYKEPWEHNECIQSIWKLACYTHFPRCNQIIANRYLPPCASSCHNYLQACQVECCDEGVQCSFTYRHERPDGTMAVETGYADHSGPSPLCTGHAAPMQGAGLAALASLFSMAAALAS
mmetsp:Transcript_19491/g.42636  ORF Transcript_19491/g.42636 Transcript_19491/m.42636 type:complete len:277 (+) Transcript_19491:91-921(+)